MRILVTRSGTEGATLLSLLNEKGWEGLHEPLLTINIREDLDADIKGVQAFLATSSNGVEALCNYKPDLRIPLYAVGNATAAAARELGFQQVHSADGNVNVLAKLATDSLDPENGPLYHAAGSVQAGNLKETLEKAGFECRREILYETKPIKSFSPETIAGIKGGEINTVLLYSPRTAETFVNLLRKSRLVRAAKQITVICLSSAVAAKIMDINWLELRVAKLPTQESLLEILSDPDKNSLPNIETNTNVRGISPTDHRPRYTESQNRNKKNHTLRTVLVTLFLSVAIIGAGAATSDLWIPKLKKTVPFKAFGTSTENHINDLAGRLRKLESISNNNLPRFEELQAERDKLQSRLDVTLNRINTLEGSLETVKNMIAAVDTSKGPEAAETTLKKLAERLTRLEGNGASLSSENQKRLGILAEQIATIEAKVPAFPNADGSAKARAFLLAVGQLRTAVRAGRPFRNELEILGKLKSEDEALKAAVKSLTKWARDGVPNLHQLRDEFSRQAGELVQAEYLPKGDALMDRTLARLAQSLKWRRTDNLEGKGVEAIVARAERALTQSNLSNAVKEIKFLPAASAAKVLPWLKKAESLIVVNNVLDRLQIKAVALLAGKE